MTVSHRSDPFASLKPKAPARALSPVQLREVIDLTVWAGALLLKSGAQSARVERTAHLLGTALGVEDLDVVVMQEGLILTVQSGEEFRTRAQRVSAVGVNLAMLDGIARMTGEARSGSLDCASVRARLVELEGAQANYSRLTTVLLVGLACGAFSCLFGADLPAFLMTCVTSAVAMWVRQELSRRRYNSLLTVVVTAFVASAIPSVLFSQGWLPLSEEALAACVLLLVPGVPFINTARDMLRGYILAGVARGFHGILISLCIAMGLGSSLALFGLETQVMPLSAGKHLWVSVAIDAAWSGLAALGFAVLFNAPRRTLPLVAIAGAVGHALRTTLTQVDVPLSVATLCAAGAVGLVGEMYARGSRSPAGLISLPAAIPLVPGVSALRSMGGVLALLSPRLQGDAFSVVLADTVRNFMSTGLIVACLALGIALPSLYFKRARV